MKKILLTGGAGFIGSHLAECLVDKGHSVKIIDNLSSGSSNNLSSIIDKIEFVEGDIRDKSLIEELCSDITSIIHLAAMSSVAQSVEEPLLCNDINVNATLNLLEVARKKRLKKFVFASSSAVYGNPSKDAIVCETNQTSPLTPYAVSKLAGEQYCQVYSEIYRLPTISLRLFNVYGPRQNPNSEYSAVIPKFINSISNEESPIIYGDGYQTRDFVYIKDIITAFEISLKASQTGIYNIASGTSYSINELTGVLTELFEKEITPEYAPERYGEVKYSQADISLAKSKLKYNPQYNLKNGLKDIIEELKINLRV
ncbi:MAG: GDP-mannose 4,6-dehydratase [Cyanobacteriota bacterium]